MKFIDFYRKLTPLGFKLDTDFKPIEDLLSGLLTRIEDEYQVIDCYFHLDGKFSNVQLYCYPEFEGDITIDNLMVENAICCTDSIDFYEDDENYAEYCGVDSRTCVSICERNNWDYEESFESFIEFSINPIEFYMDFLRDVSRTYDHLLVNILPAVDGYELTEFSMGSFTLSPIVTEDGKYWNDISFRLTFLTRKLICLNIEDSEDFKQVNIEDSENFKNLLER